MFAIRCLRGSIKVEWLVEGWWGDRGGRDGFLSDAKGGRFFTTREDAEWALNEYGALGKHDGCLSMEIVELELKPTETTS